MGKILVLKLVRESGRNIIPIVLDCPTASTPALIHLRRHTFRYYSRDMKRLGRSVRVMQEKYGDVSEGGGHWRKPLHLHPGSLNPYLNLKSCRRARAYPVCLLAAVRRLVLQALMSSIFTTDCMNTCQKKMTSFARRVSLFVIIASIGELRLSASSVF